MLINATHLDGDVPETWQDLNELLGDSMDADMLEEVAKSFAEDKRTVVHSSDNLHVVDSFVDGRWTRCAVYLFTPMYRLGHP